MIKTDESGSIFGSVNKESILKGLRDTNLITKERIDITLDHPIKKCGEYRIPVDLGHDIRTTLIVSVQPA